MFFIEGRTGHFVSMTAKKQRDGAQRQLAYPANAETRNVIQRVKGKLIDNSLIKEVNLAQLGFFESIIYLVSILTIRPHEWGTRTRFGCPLFR